MGLSMKCYFGKAGEFGKVLLRRRVELDSVHNNIYGIIYQQPVDLVENCTCE